MDTEKTVYSYHTFVFPFVYEEKNRKTFVKNLPSFAKQDRNRFSYTDKNEELPSWQFAQYRYFNEAAKNAIYTDEFNDTDIVWNYKYDLKELSNNAGENLYFNIGKESFFSAKLILNQVRLKLYDTGVGLLVFELENDTLSDEKDIIKINEFGRRVFMSFEDIKGKCYMCADNFSITCGETTIIDGSFNGKKGECDDEIVISGIITSFLSNETKSPTTSKQKVKANKESFYLIEPIIDDRMFVACIYQNEEFVKTMGTWENGNYRYISDADNYPIKDENNASRRFYEMIFVDGYGITCFDREMIKELNKNHSYTRWLNYVPDDIFNSDVKDGCFDRNEGTKQGTIYGITEFSVVCVTGSISYIKDAFLSEYVEMMLLVIAQRASLLKFLKNVSFLASKKKYDVKETHKKYIDFESELLLEEVTPQQQGIELYNLFIKNMFVNEVNEKVKYQIDSLNTYNTTLKESTRAFILFIISLLGFTGTLDLLFRWGKSLYEIIINLF